MAKRVTDSAATDYDETRRLLYMALLAPRTKRYNLAGTLVNALRHHQGTDMDAREIENRLVAYFENPDNLDGDELDRIEGWLREQIDRCGEDAGEA